MDLSTEIRAELSEVPIMDLVSYFRGIGLFKAEKPAFGEGPLDWMLLLWRPLEEAVNV